MKRSFLIFVILFFLFQNSSSADIYSPSKEEFEESYLEYNKQGSKVIKLEEEIAKFLEKPQIPVSLDECLSVALKNNFNIKEKFETYESYKYYHKYALSKFLPDFSYQFYCIYYGGRVLVGTALVDNFNELALSSMFSVSHDLFDGGRNIFYSKKKKFQKFTAQNQLNFSKDELILNAVTSYWKLVQSKLSIQIHMENLFERINQLKLTEELRKKGFGSDFDVVRQKDEVENARRSLVEFMNEYKLRQAKLSNLMGIEIQTPLYPVEDKIKPNKLIDENISPDELYNTAVSSREDIKALKNKIQSMKYEKKEIYTDYVPKPRVFYEHRNQGSTKEGVENANVLGVYVDWYFGEGLGLSAYTRAKAKQHEINSEIIKLENQMRQIKEQILDSFYNSKLLLKRIHITGEQIKYANEASRLSLERLYKDGGDLLDVIQAQGRKTAAKIEYLEAVVDYNINQAELLFDEGNITIDKVIENYKP